MSTALGATPPRPAQDAQARDCVFNHVHALCGVLTVPENRAIKSGRTIALHYVRVPGERRSAPPIFVLAGGPGESAIQSSSGPSILFEELHRTHDLVFLDQRGTGASHPMDCALYEDTSKTLAEPFPLAAVRACRIALARTHDLNAYGSAAAADDLNALRSALGYGKISLYASSYGSMEAFVYLRRHGDTVAAALLQGVAPPFFKLPLPFPHGAQHALDSLIAECAADRGCQRAFPDFAQEFGAVNERSKAGIPIDYADPATREHVHGILRWPVFADRLRQAMYAEFTARYIPAVIHSAFQGDTAPLGKVVINLSRTISGRLAMGENLSVDCAEGVAFITEADVARESAGTFMGDTIIRARQHACNIWAVRPADRTFLEPVRSDVPVLMLSGADDPATPPKYGAMQLRYLPKGRQIIIPHGMHVNGSICLIGIWIDFLNRSTVKGLQTSCVADNKPPLFDTSPSALSF